MRVFVNSYFNNFIQFTAMSKEKYYDCRSTDLPPMYIPSNSLRQDDANTKG